MDFLTYIMQNLALMPSETAPRWLTKYVQVDAALAHEVSLKIERGKGKGNVTKFRVVLELQRESNTQVQTLILAMLSQQGKPLLELTPDAQGRAIIPFDFDSRSIPNRPHRIQKCDAEAVQQYAVK